MTRDEAAVVFARLVSHWPRLGGADEYAASRAKDWITSLTRLDPEVGMAAADQVIASHRDLRLPVFADVQDAARNISKRRELERGPKALPTPYRRLSQGELAAILRPAREKLMAANHERKVRS